MSDRNRKQHAGTTVDEVCAAYLDWHKAQGSSKATIRTYWLHLTRCFTFVHDGVRYGYREAPSIVPEDLGRIKASGKDAIRPHLHEHPGVRALGFAADRVPRARADDPVQPPGRHDPPQGGPAAVAGRAVGPLAADPWGGEGAREQHRPHVQTRATLGPCGVVIGFGAGLALGADFLTHKRSDRP